MRRNPLFFLWIILVSGIALVLGSLNVPNLYALYTHGAPVSGRVEHTDCPNHASATYSYAVGGRTYRATDDGIPDCEELRRGDPIAIYFDVRNPTVNRVREPRSAFINEVASILLACLIFPSLIIYGMRRWFRKRW